MPGSAGVRVLGPNVNLKALAYCTCTITGRFGIDALFVGSNGMDKFTECAKAEVALAVFFTVCRNAAAGFSDVNLSKKARDGVDSDSVRLYNATNMQLQLLKMPPAIEDKTSAMTNSTRHILENQFKCNPGREKHKNNS